MLNTAVPTAGRVQPLLSPAACRYCRWHQLAAITYPGTVLYAHARTLDTWQMQAVRSTVDPNNLVRVCLRTARVANHRRPAGSGAEGLMTVMPEGDGRRRRGFVGEAESVVYPHVLVPLHSAAVRPVPLLSYIAHSTVRSRAFAQSTSNPFNASSTMASRTAPRSSVPGHRAILSSFELKKT